MVVRMFEREDLLPRTGSPVPVLPPGPDLVAALAAVTPRDVQTGDLVDALRGWERVAGWVTACQARVLAEFAHRRLDAVTGVDDATTPAGEPVRLDRVSEFAEDEVAAALSVSRVAARGRLEFALELCGRLPGTLDALAGGRIGTGAARRIADALTCLPAPLAARVETVVLPRAAGRTPAQVGAVAARAVLAVDPAAAQDRHVAALARRRVEVFPQPDGMAAVWALLRADEARRVLDTLHTGADAAAAPGDRRSHDQRMADVFTDLLTPHHTPTGTPGGAGEVPDPGSSRGDGDGRRAGRRRGGPAIQVLVAAATLAGTDDAPGELAGHGPIPAALARELAAQPDGTWRRILTDPTDGTLLDVGRRLYRPPAALARHVRTRDQTCRFPGCRHPADRCDLDHLVPFPTGPTAHHNLGTECRHHHRCKHHTDWHAHTDPQHPGTITWTSPTGHRYTDPPPPLLDTA
jgi:hypothetical protein